jgi:YD repeat-containing protein
LLLSVKDANNNIASYGYDANRRVATTYQAYGSPDHRSAITTYELNGEVKEYYGYDNVKTAFSYTAAGQVSSTTRGTEAQDAVPLVTGASYDGAGKLKTSTDASGLTTIYSYDAAGRSTGTLTGYGFTWRGTSTQYEGEWIKRTIRACAEINCAK